MAMVIKKRARKAQDAGYVITAVYPHGVGGIDGHYRCIGLEIGDTRIIMTKTEWLAIIDSVVRLEKDIP